MLVVSNLCVDFSCPRGQLGAVRGSSFQTNPECTTAIVGESGCGKSVTALSVLRLLPPNARVTAGQILFDGRDLLTMTTDELRRIRGSRIGMVFQEPMSALNPVMSIGRQISEILEHHVGLSRRDAGKNAIDRLAQVALPDPARIGRMYPHQLSGGMRQRVMIAIALAADPDLLIADEPTTALDVTVQAQILALLKSLTRERGRSLLLITHDFGVVAAVADDVVVMYAGRVVEQGPVREVLARPRHPYTAGLLRCIPPLHGSRRSLPVVPGTVPNPAAMPTGCRFHPRCELGAGDERCRRDQPAMLDVGPGHGAACWKSEELAKPSFASRSSNPTRPKEDV